MSKPDIPVDDTSLARPSSLGETSHHVFHPINEYDALMRTQPGDDPDVSVAELQALRDLINDATDLLEPKLRWIVDCIHRERWSYRQLEAATGIPSSTLERWMRQAEADLRDHLLLTSTTIRERVYMNATWDEAAAAAVRSIAPIDQGSGFLSEQVALDCIDRKIEHLRKLVHTRTTDVVDFVPAMSTIGLMAANILANQGAWSEGEMVDLLIRKQADYGHGNINAFGIIGVVVRMSDKVARYHNLRGKQAATEPRVDALVDLVGYATIAVMLQDGTFNLPLYTEGDAA